MLLLLGLICLIVIIALVMILKSIKDPLVFDIMVIYTCGCATVVSGMLECELLVYTFLTPTIYFLISLFRG